MTDTVLLVEDDSVLRRSIAKTLAYENFEVIEAGAFIAARDHIANDFAGVILTDIRMEGKDGFDLLNFALSIDADLPVIMLTGEGDVPMAVHAIRSGAFDFLEKPCHPDDLLRVLRQAVAKRSLVMRNRELEARMTSNDPAAISFPGTSTAIMMFRGQLRKMAELPVNVHISGEQGTGRVLAATCICQLAGHTDNHLNRNLSDCDEEFFNDLAKSDLPPFAVVKNVELASNRQQELLAAFMKASPATRIITTSSVGLEELLGNQLNKELYFLISVAHIEVPALRSRPEDALPVFHQMLHQQADLLQVPVPALPPKKLATITDRVWEGNLSELRQYAQQVLLGLDDERHATASQSLNDRIHAYERTVLIDTLKRHKGHTAEAARELQIPVKTLYDRLGRHGLKSSAFR